MVYRLEVCEGIGLRKDGIFVIPSSGETVVVDGVTMVRIHGGTIVSSDGWHATELEARREAADKIELFGRKLLEQAAGMRETPAAK